MALKPFKFLLYTFSLASLSCAKQEVLSRVDTYNSSDPMYACDQIAAAISGASQVHFPREHAILSFRL